MGMQRRLNLLRALLLLDLDNEAQPKLLVLDEVSRGLDEDNIARLVDTVQAVQAEHNVGLLIISHDLGFISQVCNQTRMLFRGALLPKRLGPNELNTPERIDALNPYYRDFIQGADEERIPPEDREPLDSFGGCLYARYIRCVNRHQTGCIDVQLNRAGEIGLCE
jgi:ABC-type multidrug transport system ATPase subunit